MSSYKIYPSSFAAVKGSTTDGFSNNCPRFLAYKHLIRDRPEIPKLYMTTGHLVEEYIVAQLEADPEAIIVEREAVAKLEVQPGVTVSGRIDLIVKEKGEDWIWEIKSTSTRAALTKVINQGVVKVAQLGQLITYMVIKQIPRGVLSVSYVHFDKAVSRLEFETRNFRVTTTPGGTIYIDGIAHKDSVVDLLKFYKVIADAYVKPELPPKIANDKACLSCPFLKVCENNPKVREDFDRLGKELDETINQRVTPKVVKLQCHNIRGKL